MKTILMLLNNPFSPDTRVLREAESLAQKHKVIILAWRKAADLPYEDQFNGILIKRFDAPSAKNKITKFLEIIRYGSSLESNVAKKLIGLGVKEEISAVHAHDLSTLEAGYRISKEKSVPLIYDSHEIFLEAFKNISNPKKSFQENFINKLNFYRLRIAEKLLARKAKAVITVNPFIEDYLTRKYDLTKTLVIFNSPPKKYLNNPSVKIREKLNIPPDDKVAAYHGGLLKKRGVIEIAESARILPDNIHILLIGEGGAKKDIDEIINNYKRKNLHIMDNIPYENLISSLKEIDLSLIATKPGNLNQLYTSPNKLFESLLAGVPILAPNYPFLAKVINETGMGMIYDDQVTPENLAKNIEIFFTEKESQMPENFESPYVWEKEEEKLLNLYNELI